MMTFDYILQILSYINCPLEKGEDKISLLLEILDNTFYLTIICVILNYFILIQYILKYLSENNFEWIKFLPLGNKLYYLIIKYYLIEEKQVILS